MNNNEKSGWLVIAISLGAVLIFGAFVLSWEIRNRTPTRIRCVINLKQIQTAKQLWATDKQATNGTLVALSDLLTLLADKTIPICPESGSYSLGRIGEPPTCTVPGHYLP